MRNSQPYYGSDHGYANAREELLANGRNRLLAQIADLERQRTVLGEKVLEEQRMRYEVEREDAVALAEMKAQRDALADAGYALGLLSLQSDRYRDDPEFRDAVDEMLTALRAAGRLS